MSWSIFSRSGLVLLATFILLGCGSGMSGKYVSANGVTSFTLDFQPGGKVFVEAMGEKAEGTYKVDGDQVTVDANGKNIVLTKSGDSLTGGPMGMSFKKQ